MSTVTLDIAPQKKRNTLPPEFGRTSWTGRPFKKEWFKKPLFSFQKNSHLGHGDNLVLLKRLS